MSTSSPDTAQLLERLVEASRRLEHLVSTQAWDEIVDHAPEIERLCELLRHADLAGSPALLLQAENFVVLEQKIRPILSEKLQDLRHELSSQQNTGRLTNTYSL
ncbi:MAG: hypothetical protein L6Q55_02530 [Azonexus sp.]|nr:hypothetical protein [Azonexus sp.]MCK6411283.1 hypothetical protein [Azonexus sp.]